MNTTSVDQQQVVGLLTGAFGAAGGAFFRLHGVGRDRSLGTASAGLSLVEALVSFALIGVGILALLSAMVASGRSNAELGRRDLALEAAQSQLERILAHPEFETVIETFDGAHFDVPGLKSPIAGELPGRIRVVPSLDADGNPVPELLECTATVSWQGRDGPESASLSMLLTDRDP